MTILTAQPLFVLVQPQMGENIGAAARAMWNFELDRMAIVDPRDGWPNQRAVAMASGAGRLLDQAVLTDTTNRAVGDCDFVFATTARHRGVTKPVMTPERAMAHARALATKGKKVAVLFGPERSGLEVDDVAIADAIISVPVNAEFASLNLGQCVLLLAYEWQRLIDETPPEVVEMAKTSFATKQDVAKMADHFEERLQAAGFFYPDAKARGMRMNLRNMWGRLPLTRADVQILHGILRQMVRWKESD